MITTIVIIIGLTFGYYMVGEWIPTIAITAISAIPALLVDSMDNPPTDKNNN